MISRRRFLANSAAALSALGQQVVNPNVRGAPFLQRLTVFDREGKLLRELGDTGFYSEPDFSPDGAKLAVTGPTGQNISVFDLTEGVRKSGPKSASQPIWSPDGSHIGYASFRDQHGALNQSLPDDGGSEELLYRYPQAARVNLADWSRDGKFLTFFTGNAIYILPFEGRRPLEFIREEYNAEGGSISPDGRFIAYRSLQSGQYEIYVKTLDFSSSKLSAGQTWQVSEHGGISLIQWRSDGGELYYLGTNGALTAVEITTRPVFRILKSRSLFQVPQTIPLAGKEFPRALGSFSRDGQQVVLATPIAPIRKEVTVARSILAKYAGTYSLPEFGVDAVISVEGEQLMIEYGGQGKLRLFAESEKSFFLKFFPGDFDFVEDTTGRVTHFVQYFGTFVNTAKRR